MIDQEKISVIASGLTSCMLDTLVGLVEEGPLWSEDVPSKLSCDALIAVGLAFNTVVRMQKGYIAASSLGADVYMHYFGQSTNLQDAQKYRMTQQ